MKDPIKIYENLKEQDFKYIDTAFSVIIWVIANITAQLLSFSYGIINNAYGIYVPNFIFLMGLTYILYVKINHQPYSETTEKQL